MLHNLWPVKTLTILHQTAYANYYYQIILTLKKIASCFGYEVIDEFAEDQILLVL
jgi:hypothetical protein